MFKKYKDWNHNHLKAINKISNIVFKVYGILTLFEMLCFIIGFVEPTKTEIISSYLLCGMFFLFVHIEFKEDK